MWRHVFRMNDDDESNAESCWYSMVIQVTLVIRPNLPVGAKYKCVFGNAPPIDAELKSLGLECKTPPLNFRPVIPDDQDHVQVDLAVRSSETNKDFVSRSFYYYNCSRHTRCRSCVKSSWGCSWCVYENRCVHDTSSCNSSSVVSGEKVGLLHMMHQVSDFSTIHLFFLSYPFSLSDFSESNLAVNQDSKCVDVFMELKQIFKYSQPLLPLHLY